MGDEVPPPAAGTQKTGIELVRGGPVGGGEKAAERFPGRGKFRFFVSALPEGPPEGLLAVVGEAEKGIVIEFDERPLEHGCGVQVVTGQPGEAPGCHQVHDRQVVHQLQPGAPGDADAPSFQGADHSIGEASTGADQYHDITGGDGPSGRFQDFPAF